MSPPSINSSGDVPKASPMLKSSKLHSAPPPLPSNRVAANFTRQTLAMRTESDQFAPELSDMDFEIATNAGAMRSTGGFESDTQGGWPAADMYIDQQLKSPANSCTKSVSLINAMQTCDMGGVGTNQKTSSYRPVTGVRNGVQQAPINTQSYYNPSTGATTTQVSMGVPSRAPPKPPSRRGSGDQPKTVELSNEEIFEISV